MLTKKYTPIFIYRTNDRFEMIKSEADTIEELARLTGYTESGVRKGLTKTRRGKRQPRCKFVFDLVYIDEE